MKYRYVWRILEAFCWNCVNKIGGKKMVVSPISLVSRKATLTTSKASKIKIGFMSAIEANTLLNADGGIINIGDRCFINRNCMIVSHSSIDIQDGVTIGPGVNIYDHDHDGEKGFVSSKICIEKNVWIGAGCIILKGVTIGENSVIAAGSVITRDVPSNVTVYQKRNTIYKERNNK